MKKSKATEQLKVKKNEKKTVSSVGAKG